MNPTGDSVIDLPQPVSGEEYDPLIVFQGPMITNNTNELLERLLG